MILYLVVRRSLSGGLRHGGEERKGRLPFFSASRRANGGARGLCFQRRPFFYSRSASASAGFIADRAYLGISVVGYFRWPVTILNSDLRNHYF